MSFKTLDLVTLLFCVYRTTGEPIYVNPCLIIRNQTHNTDATVELKTTNKGWRKNYFSCDHSKLMVTLPSLGLEK